MHVRHLQGLGRGLLPSSDETQFLLLCSMYMGSLCDSFGEVDGYSPQVRLFVFHIHIRWNFHPICAVYLMLLHATELLAASADDKSRTFPLTKYEARGRHQACFRCRATAGVTLRRLAQMTSAVQYSVDEIL